MGQFEWEFSNTHVSYPFEQPGAGVLNSLFADAVVLDTAQGQRAKLYSLEIDDWDPAYITAIVVYENGDAFFDGGYDLTISAYGQWQVLTLRGSGLATGKEVQLVLDGTHGLPVSYIEGDSGNPPLYFVAKVQECDPKAVKSIEVTDGVTSLVHVLSGDLELGSGYNVLLNQVDNTYTTRDGAVSVSASAVPGAGLGVAPSNCQPELVVRSINTVGPDNFGHFGLDAKSCYRAIIPTAGSPDPGVFNPIPAALQLFNDCGQCCPCCDYEYCYTALSRLHSQGQNTGLRLARTIDDFNTLKNYIGQENSQRKIPTMDLFLRPSPGYILGIQVNLMNNRTTADIFMNKDTVPSALVKMFVTSSDVSTGTAEVRPDSLYLFNSRYGNPWIHCATGDLLILTGLNPISDPGGIGLVVNGSLVSGKAYHVIKTTQFISMFFEIYFPGNTVGAVTVRLESALFKPYTLTKVDTIIVPFEGTT